MTFAEACATGCFVPHFRNRAIGRETARLSAEGGGRWRLRAETEIAVNRFTLRQTLEAAFDAGLGPEWCIVQGQVNSRPMSLEIEISGQNVSSCSRFAGRERALSRALRHPPLLLPDNAFAAHAVAALAAMSRVDAARSESPAGPTSATQLMFTALPAGEDVEARAPGSSRVLLGGREFPPPTISLRLAPDLDEHVWLADSWVGRMMVPQGQMRVEWVLEERAEGGLS